MGYPAKSGQKKKRAEDCANAKGTRPSKVHCCFEQAASSNDYEEAAFALLNVAVAFYIHSSSEFDQIFVCSPSLDPEGTLLFYEGGFQRSKERLWNGKKESRIIGGFWTFRHNLAACFSYCLNEGGYIETKNLRVAEISLHAVSCFSQKEASNGPGRGCAEEGRTPRGGSCFLKRALAECFANFSPEPTTTISATIAAATEIDSGVPKYDHVFRESNLPNLLKQCEEYNLLHKDDKIENLEDDDDDDDDCEAKSEDSPAFTYPEPSSASPVYFL